MTARQPAWRRAQRRLAWQRERLPIAISDFDPLAPALAAINRFRQSEQQRGDRLADASDRMNMVIEQRELERAERERQARAARARLNR